MTRLADARAKVEARGTAVVDFGIGDPLEPTDARIRAALVAGIPATSQYPATHGGRALRLAITTYLRRVFNVSLDPDREVVATNGSKEAIFHLPLALLDPTSARRGVIWGEPGYPIYEAGTVLAGGEPMPVPLRRERGFLLEPDDLDPAMIARARILWINVPHNPTGAVGSRPWLEKVVSFARKHDLVLASDECYVELGGERRATSVLEIAREGVLAFHSLSKRSGMTGYRTGFLAGDPALVGAVRALRPYLGVGTPDFVQAAAVVAWGDDAHVAERRRVFENKRAVLRSALEACGVKVEAGKGALYLWFRVPGDAASEPFALDLLERAGVLVTPGAAFGPSGEGYCRLALVPALEECDAAASAIRSALGAKP
jgi:acetylornithine aminotransferase